MTNSGFFIFRILKPLFHKKNLSGFQILTGFKLSKRTNFVLRIS